jgi:hypothetical protein
MNSHKEVGHKLDKLARECLEERKTLYDATALMADLLIDEIVALPQNRLLLEELLWPVVAKVEWNKTLEALDLMYSPEKGGN